MRHVDRTRHIGLVGFGAIGRDLHDRVRVEGHEVSVLLKDASPSLSAVPPGTRVSTLVEAFLEFAPDIVVEAAGPPAVRETVPTALRMGIPVVIASTGALGDSDLHGALIAAALGGRTKLIVPAGALGGLDYLSALAGTTDVQVRYTSRKPPAAWVAELADRGLAAADLSTAVVLFEETAAEAAHRYPRNLNAGLTIALVAGVAQTTVRVIADPDIALNTHEIEVTSSVGTATMRFSNQPSSRNPKTSAITAASLASAVRRYFEPVGI